MARVTQALILAGGLGTRLRAVFEDMPKPMAPVLGRPVLEHQVLALRDAGVTDIVLCVGHLGEMIERHFGDGERLGVRMRYARERELLGTGGAIANAREELADGPFFALNGDTLIPDVDYAAFAAGHARHRDADAATVGSLLVVRPADAGEYGVVDVAADAGIVAFREKAPVDPAKVLISGGIYLLEQAVFAYIPAGRKVSIEFEVFPTVIEQGGRLWAYEHTGFFGDIGTPAGYERVCRHLAAAQAEKDGS